MRNREVKEYDGKVLGQFEAHLPIGPSVFGRIGKLATLLNESPIGAAIAGIGSPWWHKERPRRGLSSYLAKI